MPTFYSEDRKGRISSTSRILVFKRDGWQCKMCGYGHTLTIDHIVPTSKGGTDQLFNLQTLCRRCHSEKDNMKSKVKI